MDSSRFNFEDLEVWQKSVNFTEEVIGIIDEIDTDRKHSKTL